MLDLKTRLKLLIEQMSGWDALRSLGNSRLVKLTVVVPIVGYMILFNAELEHLFDLSKHYIGNLGAADALAGDAVAAPGIAYRLYCFYFGFTFLAIGVLIYELRCPRLVKLYGSAAEYFRVEGPTTNDALVKRLALPIIQRAFGSAAPKEGLDAETVWLNSSVLDRNAAAVELYNRMERHLREKATGADSVKAYVMLNYFVPLKSDRRKSRLLVLSTYALGFLFLGVPTVLTFVSVVRSMFSSICTGLGWC